MLTIEKGEAYLDVRMPATLAGIDEADAALVGFLGEGRAAIDPFAVRILAREALLNAVVHGSREDPGRTVAFRVECRGDGLAIIVEDEGPGFDWASRDGDFDIMGDGGRGLPLMKLYATRVSYSPRGNRLELFRAYDGVTAARTAG